VAHAHSIQVLGCERPAVQMSHAQVKAALCMGRSVVVELVHGLACPGGVRDSPHWVQMNNGTTHHSAARTAAPSLLGAGCWSCSTKQRRYSGKG
jgi:hypothetical protein